MLNIKAALLAALSSLRGQAPSPPAAVATRALPLVPEGYHVSAGLGNDPASRSILTVQHVASGYRQCLNVPDCIITAQDHIDAAIDMIEDVRRAGLQSA